MLERVTAGHAYIVPYVFVAQPIVDLSGDLRASSTTVVRIAEPDDSITSRLPRPRDVNLRRWAAGAQCHVAEVAGEFAGTIWIQRKFYAEDEVRCDYLIDDAVPAVWDFDVYVEPRYRLGRTLARLWSAVTQSLAREGVRWSFSRISRFNPASVRAHERLGALVVGQAVFLVIGPLQVCLLDRRPWVHLSMSARGRTPVTLRPPVQAGH